MHQADELRTSFGETVAHYCGTQYGAKQLYTVDGTVMLRDHCLLLVIELAMSGVRLAGLHPKEIRGKYVDVNLQTWIVMFKIVNEIEPKKMDKRAELAEAKHLEKAWRKPEVHPDCMLSGHKHIEDTSAKNKNRTNAVFDVRGDPVILGDVMLGLSWPDAPLTCMLSVSRAHLNGTNWFAGKDANANHFDVGAMNNDDWSAIIDLGTWQGTTSLNKKCCRAVGFIRVVPGADTGACSHEDPFFMVVTVVTDAMESEMPDTALHSEVLFVPRHHAGQVSLLISDLPTPLAVDVFREFAANHSTWMQVCARRHLCMNLCPIV